MCFAYRGDLFEVVSAVKKLEHAPVVNAEWAQDCVIGTTCVAEEPPGFGAEGIETYQVFADGLGEFAAG